MCLYINETHVDYHIGRERVCVCVCGLEKGELLISVDKITYL